MDLQVNPLKLVNPMVKCWAYPDCILFEMGGGFGPWLDIQGQSMDNSDIQNVQCTQLVLAHRRVDPVAWSSWLVPTYLNPAHPQLVGIGSNVFFWLPNSLLVGKLTNLVDPLQALPCRNQHNALFDRGPGLVVSTVGWLPRGHAITTCYCCHNITDHGIFWPLGCLFGLFCL